MLDNNESKKVDKKITNNSVSLVMSNIEIALLEKEQNLGVKFENIEDLIENLQLLD